MYGSAIIDFYHQVVSGDEILDQHASFLEETLHSQCLLEKWPFDFIISLFNVNLEYYSTHVLLVHLMHGIMQVTIPSSISLLCMKVVWDGRTTWLKTTLSLLIVTSMKILKLTLRRRIGLYVCIRSSSSLFFVNKTISSKLSLDRLSWPTWRNLNNSMRSVLITSQKFG